MAWLAAVDYRQGTRHKAHQMPCHDFGTVAKPTWDSVVGSIAEGTARGRLSHIGAQVAAKTAAESLDEITRTGTLPDETDLRRILKRVRLVLTHEAAERNCDLSDLATTLIAFALTPDKIAALQLGEGFLIAASPARPYHSVGGNDTGAPRFVTDEDAEDAVAIAVDEGPVSFIAAGTNGLQTLSISAEDGRPHSPFLRPLNRYLSTAESDDEIHMGIREFLRSDRLAERVDDDMTLMLCGWRSEPGWENRAG
ncbi:protein phosphatase 2C domain-containing protein [Hwanghaeella grinnelliae]|uniref:Protein phosphatase 2C domain-containing protein n=1 Tax=Hwanghaeella grinnelliae TaxID=2500179 RepID=A0A3S2W6Q2_9PROT|nr:PP2C family serine/threonine-protein phosphatase [Hwanghaeella grinnelliae]RVU38577.1 protein phosphatase 2C domain-containing protein [Hwanghaeella grinnelliae]